MTADPRRYPGRVRTFWTTLRAVLTRELRWRMRGRRAFVIATVTVLVLGLVVFGIDALVSGSAADNARWQFSDGVTGEPIPVAGVSTSVSAVTGQSVFTGLLGLLTVLILLIAPALTSGAIASEREKQTLELLVTTPVSTLGMLVGKLLGSLVYVLLLIVASVPLMSLVFAFGGVAPEDLLRAYLMLLALAFGMGALGLFLSALIGRTQVATVVAYLVVFGLVVGTGALYTWMYASSASDDGFRQAERRHAPEALLWLNPLMADLDVVCSVIPVAGLCRVTEEVMGLPEDQAVPPRDAFWPRSAAAFVAMGVLLTLLATQLVSPSRRARSGGRRWPTTGPPGGAAQGAGPA